MLRYKWTSFGPMLDEDGPFVLLVDAEAAIDAMRKGNGDPFDALRVAYEQGQRDALDAAREAVEAIPAPYKIRGDFETFGPYAEGRADFKDAALSVIDALREKQ